MFKDYYAILEVSRSAHPEELKQAYRKLARKFHPDTSSLPNATSRFQEINEAWQVLQDRRLRGLYNIRYDRYMLTGNPSAIPAFRPRPQAPQKHPPRKPVSKKERHRRHFVRHLKKSRKFAVVVAVFLGVIMLDILLGQRTRPTTVLDIKTRYSSATGLNYIVLIDQLNFNARNFGNPPLQMGDKLQFARSPIMGLMISMRNLGGPTRSQNRDPEVRIFRGLGTLAIFYAICLVFVGLCLFLPPQYAMLKFQSSIGSLFFAGVMFIIIILI
ncbi:MAG: DnaJ domain-containing protein [Bacteroidota bacterium]